MLVVLAFLAFGGVAEYVGLQNEQDGQDAAIRAECLRVQTLRNLANANSARQHDADQIIGRVLVQGSLLEKLSPLDRATRVADNVAEQRIAASLLYGPPVNCAKAVDSPLHYRPPPPRPYGPKRAVPVK